MHLDCEEEEGEEDKKERSALDNGVLVGSRHAVSLRPKKCFGGEGCMGMCKKRRDDAPTVLPMLSNKTVQPCETQHR